MSKDLQSAPAQSDAADQGGVVENGEDQDASQPVQIPGERSAGAADQGGAVENGEDQDASQPVQIPGERSAGAADQGGVVEQGERKGLRQAPEASRMQGHWLLATLGKKILRPGGIALTRKMLAAAAPTSQDRIVEFGPGVGATARLLLKANPKSYAGVDPNPQGRQAVAKVIAPYAQAQYVVADAACTGLPDASADLVVGEAMLTIQSPQAKAAIVKEAARLLAPGGRYAIHEMAVSSGYSQEDFEAARKELSRTIKVGARPLTEDGWRQLMEDAGLEVVFSAKAPLRLLEPTRLIRDEGLLGALRFWNNARKMPGAKERLRTMRKAFKVQGRLMGGYVLVAKKPQAK